MAILERTRKVIVVAVRKEALSKFLDLLSRLQQPALNRASAQPMGPYQIRCTANEDRTRS